MREVNSSYRYEHEDDVSPILINWKHSSKAKLMEVLEQIRPVSVTCESIIHHQKSESAIHHQSITHTKKDESHIEKKNGHHVATIQH